ncbi:tryptophan 7-halogenase [Myxococcota bacterium]|nr:tryptophan 7-halogenase [Myxococcota bacterium]
MTPAPLEVDVLVIGAGPAGSCAAALLVQRGWSVLCLEREVFPRFVIGESLLTRCNDLLAGAGLLEAVRARGYMVKGGATFVQGGSRERVRFADGLAGDQPATWQVPRDDFDQALATRARALGADVRFAHRVDAVEPGPDRQAVEATDLETGRGLSVRARFVLDCSGYGRVLPRLWGLEAPPRQAPRTAIFSHFEGDEREAGPAEGDIWVVTHPRGIWMWVIPFSNGRTSIGAVGDPALFEAMPGTDRDRLAALMASEADVARRTARAVPVLPTRRLSAWSKAVTRWWGPGWAVAGNAGDFLDPVFSSGVMLALETATLAAGGVHLTLRGEAFDWEREYEARVHKGIGVFRAFVDSWYRGDLGRIVAAPAKGESFQRMVTSILAGYCFNEDNPLVRDPEGGLRRLAEFVDRAAARTTGPAPAEGRTGTGGAGPR